MSVTEIVGDV